MSAIRDDIRTVGFAIVPSILSEEELARLEGTSALVPGGRGGQRNLLEIPEVLQAADARPLRELVEPVLGRNAFPVRALLFDKTVDANWKVTWHQDLSIAVRERREVPGYGPWSIKEGVPHVQPPVATLEQMLALRVHLDDCGVENGPVRVLPGTHSLGKIEEATIPDLRARIGEQVCVVPRGGAMLMRPLLLHASSPAAQPSHRRVIHIEYAAGQLAGGLEWRWSNSRVAGAA